MTEEKTDVKIEIKKFFYTDMQIIGNLVNTFIKNKNYSDIKILCSSIQKINHLKDDFRKLISFLEKKNQLSDYLFNYHDKTYNFDHFKQVFKKLNNIETSEHEIKIMHPRELCLNNTDNFRLFVKIVGNTKLLSSILDVKKMQIMWIANTPVWFVPYENLHTVLNTARGNNIEIKVEKIGSMDYLFK